MPKIRASAAIGAALLASAYAAPAFADGWQFILINDAGAPIRTVDLMPPGGKSWIAGTFADTLRDGTVNAGQRDSVVFEQAGSACRYDVHLTFLDGTSAVWPNLDLCKNAYVTFHYRNGTPTADAH